VAVEVARVEAARIAGLGQQRLRPHRVVHRRRRRPVEVEAAGNDTPGDLREPKQLGLVVTLAVEGEGAGLTHATVVPGRLRVPLIEEADPEGRVERGVPERQPWRSLELLGERATDQVGYVALAALQRDQARRLVRDDPEDQPLDARGLAPELVGGLQD